MKTPIASVAFAIVLAAPLLVAAQDQPAPSASPAPDFQMQMQKRRAVVLPRPPQEAIVQDAEAAREKVAGTASTDVLLREQTPRAPRRPDLDYSVTNGISARNVDRLLRR